MKRTDFLLDWMCRNLPPEQINLASYCATSWMGDKTIEDVLTDGELAAAVPECLLHVTLGTEEVQ